MQKNNTAWVETATCVVAFILVTILYAHFQPRITRQGGQGWDGTFYYKMAAQIANGKSIRAEAPYVYRVGLPLLAASLNKSDLLSGFERANLAANFLILFLFMAWLRIFIADWKVRCLVTLMFLTQWHGPFRWISFYPASTDNFQYLFFILGFLGLQVARTREIAGTILVSLTVLVGVFFRETVALVGFSMVFLSNPICFKGIKDNLTALRFGNILRMPKFLHCVPTIVGLCALVGTHLMVHKVDDGYTFSKTAFNWVYDKPWLTYLHAVFITFGPVIVLVAFNWRKSWAFLESNQPFLVFTMASGILAYIGGNDTERYIYMSLPVIYVLIGKAIEDNSGVLQSRPLMLLLCVTQMISQRVVWMTPDSPNDFHTPFPVLTVRSSKLQYFDLWSYHGRRVIEAVSLTEYVLLAIVLIWWLQRRAARVASPSPSSH